MANVGKAALTTITDPRYRETLREALGEVRDNVERMGRDNAIVAFGNLVHDIGDISRVTNEVMLVAIMFELADTHTRIALVDDYADARADQAVNAACGNTEAALDASQRAAFLKARITGEL